VIWLSLLLILLVGPLRAAITGAIGTVRSDGVVYLDQAVAQREATVYSGDLVRTEEGRAVVSFVGGDRLLLNRQSRASFQRSSDGFSVSLERGQLSLSTSTP